MPRVQVRVDGYLANIVAMDLEKSVIWKPIGAKGFYIIGLSIPGA